MSRKKLKVAIIFGGKSEEREVSLRSGATVARYLDTKKYDVFPIEISSSGRWLVSSPTIKSIGKEIRTKKSTSTRALVPVGDKGEQKIDVALLVLHGPGGEDGTIQGMLELLGIPYTCSGVLASSVAMDKARTKRMVAAAGVPVLPDVLISKKDYQKNNAKILKRIHGTVVIKPNQMGSSIGVTISSDKKILKRGIEEAFKHDAELLIEPFVAGREISVPVLGNRRSRALPVIEILLWKKSKFYDYAAKYQTGGSEHVIPAPLTPAQTKQVQDLALRAHQILGCRGVTRSDFILDKNGNFHFLEINTIPGMTPTSLVPQSAEAAGISFPRLLDIL
ncbi:MAG: D-alanine--D-alanine ligase, partial [Patescibacteria group bacterium]